MAGVTRSALWNPHEIVIDPVQRRRVPLEHINVPHPRIVKLRTGVPCIHEQLRDGIGADSHHALD